MEKVQAPAEIAQAGYAAWNSGDVETFVGTVHPEIVWTTSGVFPGLRTSYSGHAGIRSFWDDFAEPWERIEIEIEEMAEIDETCVLVQAHFHAIGREGIEVDRQIVNYMAMSEGKLYRFRAFGDWDQALAHLGIEDPRDAPAARS
jgi:ketosteroid isomerase-like protein